MSESNLDATLYQAPEEQEQAVIQSTRGERVAHTIAGYSIQELLGVGTFGEVWAGVQVRTGQRVALKVFTQPRGLDWQYFLQEIERLRDVAEHPHIVTLLDADLEHDPPYLAMPLLSGGSLAQRAGPGKLPSNDEVATWLEQMAGALEYVHGKNMLHCDLKPVNVLVDAEGRARLVDFGQSLRRGEGRSSLGTMGYMAPEQLEVAMGVPSEPDPRWDVYSLGATAYYLLTANAPRLPAYARSRLEGTSDPSGRMRAYADLVRVAPLVPIRKLNPRAEPELAAIVEACLAYLPEERTPSAQAVVLDLQRRRARLPLLCRRPWKLHYRAQRLLARNGPMVLQFCVFMGLLLGGGLLAADQVQGAMGAANAARDKAAGLASVERAASAPVEAVDAAPLQPATELFARLGKEAGGDVAVLLDAEAESLRPESDRRGPSPYPFRLIWMASHPDLLKTAAIAGSLVAATFWDGRAELYRLSDGKPLVSTPLGAVALGGRVVVGGGTKGNLYWWDAATGKELQKRPSAPIAWVEIEGKVVASGTRGGEVRLWDLASARPLSGPLQVGSLSTCSLDPTGRRLAVVDGQGRARVYEAASGRPLTPYVTLPERCWDAEFSFDGRQLVLRALTGRPYVWNLRGQPHRYEALSPDCTLALQGVDVIGTWTGKKLMTLPQPLEAAGFSYDDRNVTGKSGSQIVRVSLLSLKTVTMDLDMPVSHCYNTPDGRLWIKADTEVIMGSGCELRHDSSVVGMGFDTDSRWLLSGTRSGELRLWDLSPPAPVKTTVADRDLPAEAMRLQAQLAMGSRLHASDQPVALNLSDWRNRRELLRRLLQEHGPHCRYPEATHWRTAR